MERLNTFRIGLKRRTMNIKLELDINEINVILTQLAEGPYKTVEPLITKIRGQALPQISEVPDGLVETPKD